jgi:hypothetical protein
MIVVVEGELRFGNRVVHTGSSVFIPATTLYEFRAGDAGARYLNFRPREDNSYLLPKDVVAPRSKQTGTT